MMTLALVVQFQKRKFVQSLGQSFASDISTLLQPMSHSTAVWISSSSVMKSSQAFSSFCSACLYSWLSSHSHALTLQCFAPITKTLHKPYSGYEDPAQFCNRSLCQLRNMLPRVSQKRGTCTVWKALKARGSCRVQKWLGLVRLSLGCYHGINVLQKVKWTCSHLDDSPHHNPRRRWLQVIWVLLQSGIHEEHSGCFKAHFQQRRRAWIDTQPVTRPIPALKCHEVRDQGQMPWVYWDTIWPKHSLHFRKNCGSAGLYSINLYLNTHTSLVQNKEKIQVSK